jgi:hypothetical protein
LAFVAFPLLGDLLQLGFDPGYDLSAPLPVVPIGVVADDKRLACGSAEFTFPAA